MKRISVSQVCGHALVTRPDGAKLREAILSQWSDKAPLEIDFEGISIASVSFFDEALARLALEYSFDELRKRIRPIDLTEPDRQLLNSLLQARKHERDAKGPSNHSATPGER